VVKNLLDAVAAMWSKLDATTLHFLPASRAIRDMASFLERAVRHKQVSERGLGRGRW
jgi:hypothetical protein